MGIRLRALWVALALVCGGEVAEAADLRFDRIVLVSVDTLRADHLGVYGYPRPTSPHLDVLAAEGIVFERAYAPMPTTAPSHATLFTSLHPLQHGITANGMRLPAGVATLAERFAGHGFTTAGFTSTHAHWTPSGLDRGFSVFDPRPAESHHVYRQADATVDAALDWLATCGRCDRTFVFVHLFDPHTPLRPPPRHLAPFREAGAAVRARHLSFLEERGIPLAFYGGNEKHMLSVIDRYDAEIRFADEALGRLQALLRDRPGRTLLVVTADHGEGLGSHRFLGHGKIYEEGIRVPLIFHASDGSLGPARIGAIVEHTDLAPTLLALAGVESSAIGEGLSLLGLLRGERHTLREGAFAQRSAIPQGPGIQRMPSEDPGDLSAGRFAWVEERWKYLHHETAEDELYDLQADPSESQNLLSRHPEEARRLRAALLARLEALSARGEEPAPAFELDEQTIEELRALGYLP